MLTALHETFWDRLVGVVRLDRATYGALRRDAGATGQALVIVIFLGLANGISMVMSPVTIFMPDASDEMARVINGMSEALTFDTTGRRLLALVVGVIVSVGSWLISSWLLRVIGNRFAGTGRQVTTEEMRRLEGWGYAPSLAAFLTPIPALGPLLATAGMFWSLVTGVMALRAAFDIGIARAIVIEIAAFLILLFLMLLILIIILMLALPSA
jgi:hypothetical protein